MFVKNGADVIKLVMVLFALAVSACDRTRVYFTPGPDCENNIIGAIGRAKTIDIAVYAITNENIGNAIIAAHNRGANIRIITDRVQAANGASLVPMFRASNIPVLTNRGYKIEHNKFAVFDGRSVVTGSYNWTRNASLHNSENCMFTTASVRDYAARFEYLWNIY